MRFLRYAECPVDGPLLFIGALFEEPGRGSFARTFERKEKCIWVPFWTWRPLRF
jgi:hypothetical protein